MAPAHFSGVQKKWIAGQLRRAASMKTLAGLKKYQKTFLDKVLDGEKDTKARSVRQYPTKLIHSKITFTYKFST
jgi:hypothetical protein